MYQPEYQRELFREVIQFFTCKNKDTKLQLWPLVSGGKQLGKQLYSLRNKLDCDLSKPSG